MSVGKVKLIVVIILLLGVTACSPIIKIEQPQITDWIKLVKTQSIGQTFTARYNGLEGIEINVNPDRLKKGKIILHLKNDPRETNDIATSEIPITKFSKSNSYKLKFSPQNQSLNRDYYIVLEIEGDTILSLGIAPGDSYQNGALYSNNEPLDNQLWFNLIYNRKLALIGILFEILGWIKYLAVGIFLFIIPGWGLLLLLDHQWAQKYWYEKAGLSAGLSLAIYPILFLWTHIIGLNLGAIYAWFPQILGIIIIIWKKNREIFSYRFRLNDIKQIKITDILLLFITSIIIFVRFWAIRNLPAPMWGDGFQHTVISQLLVDNKGLFDSWQPYAEITSFTYHFGFHTLTATFHWITGLSLPQATLWTGQILNVLAVICLVPLANKINKNPWGSIFCIILAGLISPMPMYYLNWGRYTQLAGQVILIACVYYAWECFENKQKWQLFTINWILMGGLALTHYRVLIFALCFYLSYLLFNLRLNLNNIVVRTMIIGIGSLIIFCPWLIHVFEGRILTIFISKFNSSSNIKYASIPIIDPIGDISFYLPIYIWGLFFAFFIWRLFRREKIIVNIYVWWFLIFFVANPQLLYLPGSGALTNFAVFIGSYIPVSITLGGIFGNIIDWLFINYWYLNWGCWKVKNIILGLLFVFLFIALIGIRGRQLLYMINPNYFSLLTYPDLKAMKWIKENTDFTEKFLVNSFLAYNNTTSVGSDGGWWLPYFTCRPSTSPPLNYTSEKNSFADYSAHVKLLTTVVQEKGITSPETWKLIKINHVTHIYIGQKQGVVNNSGSSINPLTLLKDNRFRVVYRLDRVWVFEVIE